MELQKSYIVVKITNSSADFAENWIKIKYLKDKNNENIVAESYNNFYYYDASMVAGGYGALIADINRKIPNLEEVNVRKLPSQYGICLWIEDHEENDTIEYEYLALMLQNWHDVVAYIYPQYVERTHEIYQKVSCFFSFFIQKTGRKERIWIQRETSGQGLFIETLGTELTNNSYKITPILEFDTESDNFDGKNSNWGSDLEMWTRTVGDFLKNCKDIEKIRNIESHQEILTQLRSARQKNSKQEIEKWTEKSKELDNLCRSSFDNRFLCRCINYFVAAASSYSVKFMVECRKIFWSDEIQNILSNIPIISFYMLCMQLYFLKDKRRDFEEEVKLLIVNAEGMTEGVIQLLENLHHNSERRGLLSIRIHENKNLENDYLNKEYAEIYKNSAANYFYEFRVLDYSEQSILESFRIKQVNQKLSFPENIGIRNFFEYVDGVEFWENYNQIPENLIHHYGLKLFSTIVSNNGGYFRVISSTKEKPELEREQYSNHVLLTSDIAMHIPGTEYVALLPLLKDVTPINPSVDADIQYLFDLQKQYYVEPLDILEDEDAVRRKKEAGLKGQHLKEWRINALKDELLKQLQNKVLKGDNELVGLLSAKNWDWKNVEIYCKALMLCIIHWQPVNKQGFYMIIKNCDANDFIAITRMFAIFYGNGELSNYMEHLQIYLSGDDPSEEFLIAGKNISGLLTIARKLTLVRGIQPQCLYSIEYILNKFRVKRLPTNTEESEMKLIPFDMLDMPQTQGTLFEQAVKQVLESDIQKYSFGCKLKHTHMRIGSKLHIGEFYEAELLFHNNYYVSRFALLLVRNLSEVLVQNSPIMFVGYETYSELLLYEIVKNLNDKGHDSSYMIYEGRNAGRFRYYNSSEYIQNKEDIVFVVIVPINSTMTTHSKIRAALVQEIQKVTPNLTVKVAINYALILVRSDAEKDEESNKKDQNDANIESHYYASTGIKTIEAKYLPEGECIIRYFVAVNTRWYNPLECDKCFPKKSMLEEQPLIETNRVSIIPVQMLGIQEPDILPPAQEGNDFDKHNVIYFRVENEKRVTKLTNSLIYRHIVRKGNHFIYYFELEKYFMQNREEIISWLEKIKNQQRKVEGIVYNVIVAPLHYSNAGFVTEVNSHLYGNAALVLNFEIEKEYRENVKTKYSNIIGLYKKLLDIGKEAELRFHFVDDNINTGNTFLRAKSLFTSLFPFNREGNVKVKIFEDIIVMLNRMSEASIMNCVNNRDEYYSYVSLNISAMRSHEDACTQCKVVENAQKLRNQASTNQMYEFWDRKIYHHRMIEAEDYQNALEEEREENAEKLDDYEKSLKEKQERAGRRMLCTHMFNEQMAAIGHEKNDTEQVKRIMLELLKLKANGANGREEAMEWIISGIKVFSRPFVIFRKSSREAIFQIMLELLEFITSALTQPKAKIQESRFTKYGEIKEICCVIRDARLIWGQDDKIYVLLLALMQRLSDLSSNYVIRKENFNKLFSVIEILNITEQQRECFKQRYLSIVKRITCLSSDENKCIYLEYLLMFQEEYTNAGKEKENIKKVLTNSLALMAKEGEELNVPERLSKKDFQRVLFLENTRVLYDGIRDLAREIGSKISEENLWKQIKDKYYYDNFERLLKYYRFVIVETDGKEVFSGGKKVLALVNLYRMLTSGINSEKGLDVEKFYDHLLEYIETITGTNEAKLIFSYTTNGVLNKTPNKVYKKRRGMEIEIEEAEDQSLYFLYDTYTINKHEDTKVLIKYRNYVGRGYSAKDKNPMNVVYLELIFSQEMTEIQLLIALKCIMVFRNLIVENLEKDFSNNLMQKWSAEQIFRKHMKLERATDHTAKDELAKDFEMLVGKMEGCDVAYQKALFDLVINSYIARMNVQLLADALPEGENEEYSFEFLYRSKLNALIYRLRITEGEDKFEIIDENGELGFSKEVRKARIRMYRGEGRYERLSFRRLSIVIIELIRSAIKYSDNRKVYIYRENQYLVVKNSFKSQKAINVIRQEAKDAYSRKRDGISLAVIKELIDKFYQLEGEEAVEIDAQEKEEIVAGKKKKIKYYYVKLPILADKEDNAGNAN